MVATETEPCMVSKQVVCIPLECFLVHFMFPVLMWFHLNVFRNMVGFLVHYQDACLTLSRYDIASNTVFYRHPF